VELTKVVYKATLVEAVEGEGGVFLVLCREINAYILWRDNRGLLQFVSSWLLKDRDIAIENSVAISATERAKTPAPAPRREPEKRRAAMEQVKSRAGHGKVVVKLLAAKRVSSSHNKARKFITLKYSLIGDPAVRSGSCWVWPMEDLLLESVGKEMLVEIQPKMEAGTVYENFVDVFAIGGRQLRKSGGTQGEKVSYAFMEEGEAKTA
jgi:hypothetical protein